MCRVTWSQKEQSSLNKLAILNQKALDAKVSWLLNRSIFFRSHLVCCEQKHAQWEMREKYKSRNTKLLCKTCASFILTCYVSWNFSLKSNVKVIWKIKYTKLQRKNEKCRRRITCLVLRADHVEPRFMKTRQYWPNWEVYFALLFLSYVGWRCVVILREFRRTKCYFCTTTRHYCEVQTMGLRGVHDGIIPSLELC